MASMVRAENLSSAWIEAMRELIRLGGKEVNLAVVISAPTHEDRNVRRVLDAFTPSKRTKIQPVSTVANTIFPAPYYHHGPGIVARQRLYALYRGAYTVVQRHPSRPWGTYFHRLVAYPADNGMTVNQLEETILRLTAQLARPNPLSSAYELGVTFPEGHAGCAEAAQDIGEDLRIYRPGKDRRLRGGPCLSHVSLKLVERKLHMTALYRNQYFISRAYGNYVGLGRLLDFLCRETNCTPGELLCIATHADAELDLGICAIRQLVQDCLDVAADRPRAASTPKRLERATPNTMGVT